MMDIQKVTTGVTAAAVVGTGSIMGGGHIIDQQTGGPEKRAKAQESELRMIVREELKSVLWEAWPEKTGGVKGLEKPKPNGDYRQTTPQR
tara:strand:- start:698 stop:967 length:270 start_codon:yes stop_codon:yes gene_type:complete